MVKRAKKKPPSQTLKEKEKKRIEGILLETRLNIPLAAAKLGLDPKTEIPKLYEMIREHKIAMPLMERKVRTTKKKERQALLAGKRRLSKKLG